MVEVIYGNVPSKSNCYKVTTIGGKARMYKAKALKEYEKSFMYQIGLHKDLNISTHFRFSCCVYFPSRRSDIDNAAKVLLDCLERAGAIKNDNLCYQLRMDKAIDKDNPRVEFEITEI